MGPYFSDGIVYATIGTKTKIISVNTANGEILGVPEIRRYQLRICHKLTSSDIEIICDCWI